ncbi:MAG: hypothetical protein JRG86_11945 [Deltaproteobacteria bacterium]|jgi:hypothetical protein|nr:hypothetical protein [Deltaproteobacteria bacterium]
MIRVLQTLAFVGLVLASAAVQGEEKKKGSEGRGWPPSPEGAETWHATTFVSSPVGFRVIDYWSKGDWMRANTLISGHPITTLVRGDRYVVYDVLTGEGLSIRRSKRARKEDAKRERAFGNDLEEIIAAGGEKVEDTRLSGVDATMWRLTDTRGRRTVWVRRRKPVIPLRVETFDRASSETVAVDYANWAAQIAIPDRFFEPPAGLELRKLDYEAFVKASQEGRAGPLPVLYPDLLHGGALR